MPTVDQIRHRITRPTAVTSTVDGRDHRLSQQATTAGLVAGHGTYTALCGRPVVAASLVTPAGGRPAWTARQHCAAAPQPAPRMLSGMTPEQLEDAMQRRTVLVAGSVAVFGSSVVGYGGSRKLPAPSYPQPDASLPSRWA